MFKNIIQAFALVICLGAFSTSAQAITIDGQEYDKFLQISTPDRLGYWVSMGKYYTYDNVANSPTKANTVFKDDALNGFDIGEFYAMGTTKSKTYDADIKNGVFNLYDKQGAVLLGGTTTDGRVDSTRIKGTAGQLNVTGLYTLNSGKFHDLGLVQGPIYVSINYDNIVALGSKDTHAQNGTITFYSRGGVTEVPEPATVALLASSLFGAGRLRRKKKAA